MIDRHTIDRIMDATNIVDVVGEFVTLRRAGVNYKGLCPFHNEKTPSFVVSPAKGVCHCFGCGKGGNAINFLMEHEQMNYPEALRWLAKKYHIEIVEKELTEEEKKEASDRESMFIVNEWAMKYFQDILYNNVDGKAIGMQYFRSRGFRDDIIQKFQLGYSLSGRDALAQAATKQGFQKKYLISTGLCYEQDNGKLHDRYYGRVIFPWLSMSGKVCAFGGRLLDSRTKGVNQKYVNSPESEIYHKSKELYGIFQAKKAIVREDLVYMVEGYTDVISMHQCGIENVVANSGTALSTDQIRLLRRFTSNIILLYDGDAAGKKAAMRGTDMLLAEGMNIKIVLLPESEDPDSYARSHTAEEYQAYIDANKVDFIVFKIQLMLDGVTDPTQRSEAISSIVKSISVIRDPIKRDTYIHECSQRTGYAEKTLIRTMNQFIRNEIEEREKRRERESQQGGAGSSEVGDTDNVPTMRAAAPTPKLENNSAEALLVRAIIRHGSDVMYEEVSFSDGSTGSMNIAEYINFDLQSDGMTFTDERHNHILAMAVEESAKGGFNSEQFFTQHPDCEISKIATSMSVDKYHLSRSLEHHQDAQEIRNEVMHLMMDFKLNYYQERLKQLQASLKSCLSDFPKMKSIMAEIKSCQERRNILAKELGVNIKK